MPRKLSRARARQAHLFRPRTLVTRRMSTIRACEKHRWARGHNTRSPDSEHRIKELPMSGSTSLALLLPIMVVLLLAASVAAAPAEARTRFPLLSDAECWRKLPPTQRGGGQPLPSWAQALAGTMPRTTAAFLHLDQVHRAGSPIDAKLRALMRWVAARANQCAYSEAYAV